MRLADAAVIIMLALVLGVAAGASTFLLMGRRDYQRGVLAGQWQAEMTHDGWHTAVADSRRPDLPHHLHGPLHRRRLAPDPLAYRTAMPPRPVLHDDRPVTPLWRQL